MSSIMHYLKTDNQLETAGQSLALSGGQMTIEEIYSLFREHLSSKEGLVWSNVDGFEKKVDWSSSKMRSKTRTIYRKARNAKKYMEYTVAYKQSINRVTLKGFKDAINQLYEKGKLTRRNKNAKCIGLNVFLSFCEDRKIRYCVKGVVRDKYNIKGMPLLLEFSEWIKARSKVQHETGTAYLSVIRVTKFLEFIQQQDLSNQPPFGTHMLRRFIKEHDSVIGTKNNYINSIRLFMRFWLEKGSVPEHALSGVKEIAKFEKLEDDTEEVRRIGLTSEERDHLLKLCADPLEKVLITLCAYQGLRIFSVLHLRHMDVNLKARTIDILCKGRNSRVTRPISKACHDALEEYIAGKSEYDLEKTLLHFTSEGGVHGRIVSILERAGLRKVERLGKKYSISPHALRHTFAQLLLDSTNDLGLVSKMLCHKNITTTTIYLKSRDKEKMDAVFEDEFLEEEHT